MEGTLSNGILPPQGVGSFEKQNSCFDEHLLLLLFSL